MIDPNAIVRFSGEKTAIKDIPSAPIRHLYGLGHFSEPGRKVIASDSGTPWPHEPESCPRADETPGVWINGDTYLVCPGCGMDGT